MNGFNVQWHYSSAVIDDKRKETVAGVVCIKNADLKFFLLMLKIIIYVSTK